jgi:hypothetical protein
MTASNSDARFIDSLGTCCSCKGPGARVIVGIEKKAPRPGNGTWRCKYGCWENGAIAVLCQPCADAGKPIRLACVGEPAFGDRIDVKKLKGRVKHDFARHQEEG